METNLCVAGFGGQGVMTLGKSSGLKYTTFFASSVTP